MPATSDAAAWASLLASFTAEPRLSKAGASWLANDISPTTEAATDKGSMVKRHEMRARDGARRIKLGVFVYKAEAETDNRSSAR